MPEFTYLIRDTSGRMQRGHMGADSMTALRATLEARGERLVSAKLIRKQAGALALSNPLHRLPPRSIAVEVALEQLSVMLESGIGLLQALRTVADQAASASLRSICLEVSEDIQEGDSFSEAMSKHACFPRVAVQLARVGETTGNLDVVLQRAARQMASRRENLSNVRTAVAYPIFVGLAALGVAAYLVIFVIPELEKFLAATGRQLPAITQSLLDFSVWIRVNGVTTAAITVFAVIAAVLVYKSEPGRFAFDRWILRVPIIGKVLRLAGTVTFASSLGVLLRSGVTVLEALRTVEELHGNQFLASRVGRAREMVMEGGNLSTPLVGNDAFMPMLASMVAVGENTGQLDEVLDRVTRFHEAQLKSAIKKLSALIEPMTIVLVGGIVGYVYLAFFMALFAAGG